MKVALSALLFDNPLDIYGLPLGSSMRDVRHRLDELEMTAALGGTTGDLAYVSRILNDPESLIECELFTEWKGHTEYGVASEPHDEALHSMRVLLNRQDFPSPGSGAIAIRKWGKLSVHDDFQARLQDRFRELNLPIQADTWFAETFERSILPAMVRKSLDADVGTAKEVAAELGRLNASTLRTSQEELIKRIEPQIARDKLEHLSTHYIVRLIPRVSEIATSVRGSAPDLWNRTMSDLASSTIRIAHDRFYDGEEDAAEQILGQLASIDLPEADAIRARGEAAELRYAAAWKVANEYAERGQWKQVVTALEHALTVAPDEARASEVREWIWKIRNRR